MSGVALRPQALRQVLGETGAQGQEHRLWTDEDVFRPVAQQVLPDQEPGVLERADLHRPGPRTRRRSAGSEGWQQGQQASGGVLFGIEAQGMLQRDLRLGRPAQLQQGFAKADMGLAKLGGLGDRAPRKGLCFSP